MTRTPVAVCDDVLVASHPTELCNLNKSTAECLNVARVSHPVPVPALLPDPGLPDPGQPVDCGVCTGGDSGLTSGDSGWTSGDSGQTGGDSGQYGSEAFGVATISLSISSHKTLNSEKFI